MVRFQISRGYGKSNPYGTEFSFDDKATIDAQPALRSRQKPLLLYFFGISWLTKGEAIHPDRSDIK